MYPTETNVNTSFQESAFLNSDHVPSAIEGLQYSLSPSAIQELSTVKGQVVVQDQFLDLLEFVYAAPKLTVRIVDLPVVAFQPFELPFTTLGVNPDPVTRIGVVLVSLEFDLLHGVPLGLRRDGRAVRTFGAPVRHGSEPTEGQADNQDQGG